MKQLIYLNLPYGRIMANFSFLPDKISITTSLENVDAGLKPSHPTSDTYTYVYPFVVFCVVLVRIYN